MESAWSNGKPAYRCRHGHTSASIPDPDRPKNAYVREEVLLAHLPALHLPTGPRAAATRPQCAQKAPHPPRDRCHRPAASPGESSATCASTEFALTWDPAAATLRSGATKAIKTGKAG